jgi:hypothetical protein
MYGFALYYLFCFFLNFWFYLRPFGGKCYSDSGSGCLSALVSVSVNQLLNEEQNICRQCGGIRTLEQRKPRPPDPNPETPPPPFPTRLPPPSPPIFLGVYGRILIRSARVHTQASNRSAGLGPATSRCARAAHSTRTCAQARPLILPRQSSSRSETPLTIARASRACAKSFLRSENPTPATTLTLWSASLSCLPLLPSLPPSLCACV